MGLAIPHQFGVIHSPDEMETLDLKFPVMLKSMVLVGGRGKAGGIKKACRGFYTMTSDIFRANHLCKIQDIIALHNPGIHCG